MSTENIRVNAFHPQAYLMFLGFYKPSRLARSKLTPSGNFTGVHKISGVYEPPAVMTKLYNSYDPSGRKMIKAHFFNLETYKISSLVPELRFFKVQDDIYTPFFFPISAISDEATSQDGYSRLKATGIKSFSVRYQGSDPFTAPKYLEADLQLYVDNLANIFDQQKGYAPLADLFTISVPKTVKKKSSSGATVTSGDLIRPVEVAATLGYSIINRDIFTKEEIEEIQSSNLAIRMNVFHHQFNVNQDGSATIDVKYTARINNAGRDKIFSTLDSPVDLLKRADIRQLFSTEKKNLSSTKKKDKETPASKAKQQKQKAQQLRKILEIAEIKKMIHSVRTSTPAVAPAIGDKEADANRTYMESGDMNIYANLGVEKDILAAAAKIVISGKSKTPPAEALSLSKKGDTLVKRLSDLDLSERRIHYVLFGDLVQCFFEMTARNLEKSRKILMNAPHVPPGLEEHAAEIKKLSAKTPDEKEKIAKVIDGALSRLKTFRVLLSDIEYKYYSDSPNDNTQLARINIADVPISLELYQSFIFDKVMDSYRNTYTIPQFLSDCVSDLLPRAFGSIYGNAGIAPNIISSAPGFTSNSYSGPQLRRGLAGSPSVDAKKVESPLKNFRVNRIQDECDYFVIYQQASREIASKGNGKLDKDSREGIYHFEIGKDRGLIKTINFSRFDVPYAQEQLMTNQVGLYDELKMPYQASISMFGNNLFMPGSQIYINPKNIGFGSPTLPDSPAYRLGLGGYYTVISVETSIRDGNVETSLQCSFGSHPSDNAPAALTIGGVESKVTLGDLSENKKESFDSEPQGRSPKKDDRVVTSNYSAQLRAIINPNTGEKVVDETLARQISNDYTLHGSSLSSPIVGVSRKYVNQQTGAAQYELVNGLTVEIDDTATGKNSARLVKNPPRTIQRQLENEHGAKPTPLERESGLPHPRQPRIPTAPEPK